MKTFVQLLMLFAISAPAWGACSIARLTEITGTLYLPNGSGYNGQLTIGWGGIPWQAADGTLMPSGPPVALQIKNGAVSVCLQPTDGVTVPTPIYYEVIFRPAGAGAISMYWTVPTSASPVTLSSVIVPATSNPPVTSGIISLNGLTNPTQLFARVNDTNVTMTIGSSVSTHTFTMGWAGQLAPARGGTGDDTSAVTGVPLITAGNWTYAAAASDLSGWPAGVSMTELGYVNGVTSAIQTQLDTKVGTAANLTTANKVAFVSSAGVLTQDPNADAFTWVPATQRFKLGSDEGVGLNTTLEISNSAGLVIDSGETASIRFLPFGANVFYQTTSTTGNISFTGLNGGYTSGAVNFLAGAVNAGDSAASGPTPIQSVYPVGTIRSIMQHAGNSAGISSAGGVQIAAQGQDNSTGGSGDINFFTPTGNSGAGVDATLALRVKIAQAGGLIQSAVSADDSKLANSQFMLILTSNTNLQIRAKGSDGTVRSANITLAP